MCCKRGIHTKIWSDLFTYQKHIRVTVGTFLRKASTKPLKKKTRLVTQHKCMPSAGMQTSSYPLTQTGIALYWEKLWNTSEVNKQLKTLFKLSS